MTWLVVAQLSFEMVLSRGRTQDPRRASGRAPGDHCGAVTHRGICDSLSEPSSLLHVHLVWFFFPLKIRNTFICP